MNRRMVQACLVTVLLSSQTSPSAIAAPSFKSKFLTFSGNISRDIVIEPRDKYLPLGRPLKTVEKSKLLKELCSSIFPYDTIGSASSRERDYARTAKGGVIKSSGAVKWDFNEFGEAIIKVKYSCNYAFKKLELLPSNRWSIGLWKSRPDQYSPSCSFSKRDLESTDYRVRWDMKFSDEDKTLEVWRLNPRVAYGYSEWYNSVANSQTSYCTRWLFGYIMETNGPKYDSSNVNVDIYTGEKEPVPNP